MVFGQPGCILKIYKLKFLYFNKKLTNWDGLLLTLKVLVWGNLTVRIGTAKKNYEN